MNARLIAAMSSRREKEHSLPLKHVRIDPSPSIPNLVTESEGTVRTVDRAIGWIGVIGILIATAWTLYDWLILNGWLK